MTGWEPQWTIRGRPPPWGTAFALLTGVGITLIILWVARDTVFLEDEWPMILGRRGSDLDTWLRPHNEHLVIVNVAFYKALLATVGMDPFWPYRLVVALAHVLCVGLTFTLARRRVGTIVALVLTAPLLVFGPGWEVVIFPFGIFFLSSTVAALGTMLALDRGGRRGDAAASGLVAVALAGSSFGIPLALGVAAEVLWRSDRWRRLWIVAAPVALYGLWYLLYNLDTDRQAPLDVGAMPGFAFRAAVGAMTALLGLPLGVETQEYGAHRLLELMAYLLGFAALGVLVWRLRRPGTVTPRLVMLLTTLGAFWVLSGVARGRTEQWYAGRYVYPAGVLLVVLLAELLRDVRIGRRVLMVGIVVAAGAATLNAAWMVKDGRGRQDFAEPLAAELAAVELTPEDMAANLPVDDFRARGVTAGAYLEAADEWGSPALSQAGLLKASPAARAAADALLVRGTVRVTVLPDSPRPRLEEPVTGSAARYAKVGPCVDVRPPRGQMVTAMLEAAPVYGFSVQARRPEAFTVRVRRFGDGWSEPLRVLPAPTGTLYSVPSGSSPVRWKAEITGRGRFTVC